MVQSVCIAVHFNFDSTIVHEELVLFLESRESLLDDAGVVGVLYVDADHLCEKLRRSCQRNSYKVCVLLETYRRLAAVQIVLPRAIGHESNLVDDVQEVLNDVQSDFRERALGTQKALDDPERIPVVRFPESTTGYDECAVDGDE